VKLALGEVSYVVSLCRNKSTQSDLGTPFFPAPTAKGNGGPSSALSRPKETSNQKKQNRQNDAIDA